MTANWNNTAGGAWSIAGNWTNAALPKAGDNVTFTLSPTSYTTVIDLGYTQTGVTVPTLNSVSLEPHMTLDIQQSITIAVVNNASASQSTVTGGLVEVGNGAVLNYNVGDYNNTSLFVMTDGVGRQGTMVVDGPIDTGGTITMDGVNFDATGGIVDSTAMLTLENGATYDALASETFHVGTINLAGGGVADLAALPAGALAFEGFVPIDQQVVMEGNNNTLVLPHTGDETNLTISGFGGTDRIEVSTINSIQSVTYDSSHHLNFFSGLNGTGTALEVLTGVTLAAGLPPTLDASHFTIGTDSVTGGTFVELIPCFLLGTLIRTDCGDVPVETLQVGDTVITFSGQKRPICWIGRSRAMATRRRRGATTPVIVQKGALADNVPYADLRITKGHSLYIDDVLIPAEFLINHRSIRWDDNAQEVSVFHLELDAHDLLVANGAAAESYRDDGNRELFENSNLGWGQPPKPPCAPVLTGGQEVDAIWKRLLDRSGPRAGVPLTNDPDLHLLVDGKRLDATKLVGEAFVFKLPRRPKAVRVMSRAVVPQELGLARDPRTLGVALRRVIARRGTRFRETRADDPGLADGFHGFEADTSCRWTDGDAALPMALLDGWSGPMEIVLMVGGTTRYIEDGDRQLGNWGFTPRAAGHGR